MHRPTDEERNDPLGVMDLLSNDAFSCQKRFRSNKKPLPGCKEQFVLSLCCFAFLPFFCCCCSDCGGIYQESSERLSQTIQLSHNMVVYLRKSRSNTPKGGTGKLTVRFALTQCRLLMGHVKGDVREGTLRPPKPLCLFGAVGKEIKHTEQPHAVVRLLTRFAFVTTRKRHERKLSFASSK